MSEHRIDDPLYDYKLYRFGRSRQIFRGPQPALRGGYIAFIGSSQTFGRFCEEPFPDVVGKTLGITSLNLGTDGAGPGFFLRDPEVMRAAADARLCVVQVMCAAAISNRMFTVRPRRNVRLHTVSDLLRGIYPEVEFDRFSFVRVMLRHLHSLDEMRFKLVANEIKNAWIARMQTLLSSLETTTLILWLSERSPDDTPGPDESPVDMKYPLFVDRSMIDSVRAAAEGYVEVQTSSGMPQDLRIDGRTVLFKPSGEPVQENNEFPSPEMHADAANALIPVVKNLLL